MNRRRLEGRLHWICPACGFVEDYRFCPRCASRLVQRQAFGRLRLVCEACGFVLFRDPKTAAGALVTQDGRVLLARRAVKPELGKWYIPAGFVEYDETPAQAAVREVREETGLDITLDGLLGIYDFSDQRHGRGSLILYRGRVVGGTLKPGDDVDSVAFFGPDELPADIAFESSRQVLREWKEEQ